MQRRELIAQLIAQIDGAYGWTCQCTDGAHAGEPCQGTGERVASDDYFTYVCADCDRRQHGPILVYGRESPVLYGQIATADIAYTSGASDTIPAEDWPDY